MKNENQRPEKRPRIKAVPKQKALFSTDRTEAGELMAFFANNFFKKRDPFVR